MTLELRPVDRSEAEAFTRCCGLAFGRVPSEERVARSRERFQPDFALAVVDQGRIVATASAFPLEMTLPAAPGEILPTVAVPGVTAVGVLPTHRRQGLLSRLMARQLADLRQRGYPVSVLLASEANIYGRFGYGRAQDYQALTIERGRAVFHAQAQALAAPGRLRMVDPDEAGKLLPLVHDEARRRRPGELNRTSSWWTWHLKDPEAERPGGGARLYALHESDTGHADGWVSWRVDDDWGPGGIIRNRVTLDDLVATNPAARAALWQLVLNLDLVETVVVPLAPVDETLKWMLVDSRRVCTTEHADHLWLRILDVPAALAARGYGASERLVLEVASADPACEGRFVLESGPTSGLCRPASTGEKGHLALGLADLGALYLGGGAATALAAAGRATELRPGALAAADRVFAGPVAPFCTLHF